MGTKYIIEVEDKPFELLSEDGFTSEKLFRVKGFNSLVFDWNGLNMLTPYTEPDIEQIRNEAYGKGHNDGLKVGYEKLQSLTQERIEKAYQQAYDTAYKDAEEIYESGKRAMYQKGLSDAWEAARWLSKTNAGVNFTVFGMHFTSEIVQKISASEAIEKIRQYEQKKEEQIQVGDEVEATFGKAIVTEVKEKHVYYFYADGSYGFDEKEHVTKTGRHFPEIAEVLAKMKENHANK